MSLSMWIGADENVPTTVLLGGAGEQGPIKEVLLLKHVT
jgi:hypothetical protein